MLAFSLRVALARVRVLLLFGYSGALCLLCVCRKPISSRHWREAPCRHGVVLKQVVLPPTSLHHPSVCLVVPSWSSSPIPTWRHLIMNASAPVQIFDGPSDHTWIPRDLTNEVGPSLALLTLSSSPCRPTIASSLHRWPKER
ncbi:hypothetical protein BJV78DRAFT_1258431 [Lactifluus subvellereus]|nr:hypothetical protein BJV78DRAFT_1258431 [Lactifluus subvellereus]